MKRRSLAFIAATSAMLFAQAASQSGFDEFLREMDLPEGTAINGKQPELLKKFDRPTRVPLRVNRPDGPPAVGAVQIMVI